MRKYLVMTLVGTDQIGIVDHVTQRVLKHQGNVEESRMTHLGGEFAMMLLISVPAENLSQMTSDLADLEKEGLQVFTRQTESDKAKQYEGWMPYRVSVIGADHEGLINSVTHHFAEHRINIEEMETNTAAAPMSGTIMFTMTAIVVIPPEITYHHLRDRLEKIGDEIKVNIEVSPYTG